jgi:hypothetical protein
MSIFNPICKVYRIYSKVNLWPYGTQVVLWIIWTERWTLLTPCGATFVTEFNHLLNGTWDTWRSSLLSYVN